MRFLPCILLLILPLLLTGCGTSHTTGQRCDPCCNLRHDLKAIWPAITDCSHLRDDCQAIGETVTDTSDLKQTLAQMHDAICRPNCPQDD